MTILWALKPCDLSPCAAASHGIRPHGGAGGKTIAGGCRGWCGRADYSVGVFVPYTDSRRRNGDKGQTLSWCKSTLKGAAQIHASQGSDLTVNWGPDVIFWAKGAQWFPRSQAAQNAAPSVSRRPAAPWQSRAFRSLRTKRPPEDKVHWMDSGQRGKGPAEDRSKEDKRERVTQADRGRKALTKVHEFDVFLLRLLHEDGPPLGGLDLLQQGPLHISCCVGGGCSHPGGGRERHRVRTGWLLSAFPFMPSP